MNLALAACICALILLTVWVYWIETVNYFPRYASRRQA